jgi:tetratricopeptide (TPR) repeat protein
MHYRDFDLKLSGDKQEGYSVELLDSPLGFRTDPLPLKLPEDKIEAWGDVVKNGEADRQTSKDFGKALFEALFPQRIRDAWIRSQDALNLQSFLRLRLDIRAPELAAIPWEIIHDGDYHLAMVPRRPIVRYLYDRSAVESIESSPPIRILIAVATNTNDQSLTATESETNLIKSNFNELVKMGRVEEPFVLSPATLSGLQRELARSYQVLHFMGHGKFENDAGYLTLGDEHGGAKDVDGETFGYQLIDTGLRLLVLNACETADAAQLDPMLGVAHAALVAGIPAVVAMQGLVYDENAAIFARTFYHALVSGKPLEICMTEGRKAVMGFSSLDHSDWAIPVLFSNSLGGLLWEDDDAPPVPQQLSDPSFPRNHLSVRRGAAITNVDTRLASSRRATVLHNLTSADYLKFLGREKELQKIAVALKPEERVALINIFGVGGSGRTALAHEVAQLFLEFSQNNPDSPGAFDGIIWASAQHTTFSSQGLISKKRPALLGMNDLCFTVGKTLKDRTLVQSAPEERIAMMDDVLREGRYLLILDDADEVDDEALFDFLRNIPVPSKVIITSRAPLVTGATLIPLSSLDDETALQLLDQDALMSEIERLKKAGRYELQRLVELSDGLPLVLRWCAAQLRDSGQSISSIIEQLAQAGDRSIVEYCLSRSISALNPQQRQLLQAFALLPRPTRAALAGETAGFGGENLASALARLVQLRLVRFDEATKHYHVMFMARQYMLKEQESDLSSQRDTTRRAIRGLYSLASAIKSSNNAADLLDAEIGNVMWAAEQSYHLREWQTVLDFLEALKDFLSIRGYWNESLQLGRWAYQSAQELNRNEESAWCSIYPMAQIHFYQGKYEEAQSWCERALKLFGGNDYGVAATERFLGRVLQAKGDMDSAERLYKNGLEKARRFNTQPSHINQQGDLLSSLAGLAEARRQYSEAGKGYEDALALFRITGNPQGIIAMLHRLGSVALAETRYEDAEHLLAESLSLLKGTPWLNREAKVLYTLALLHEERGNLAESEGLLMKAREKFQTLSAPADLARTDAALARVEAMVDYEQRRKSLP